MSDCEIIDNCLYFHNELFEEIDIMLELRKQKYCKGDNSICARYMVFKELGREMVPKDLLPIQTDRAKEIIEQSKNKI